MAQKGRKHNNESNRDCENDPPEPAWSLKKYLPKKEAEERYSQTGSNSHRGRSRDDTEQRSSLPHQDVSLGASAPQKSTKRRHNQTFLRQQRQLHKSRIEAKHPITSDQKASHSERAWRRDNVSRQEQGDRKGVDLTSQQDFSLSKYQHKKSYLLNDNKQRPVNLNLLRTWSDMKDSNQLLLSISSHMKQLGEFLDQQKLQEECLVFLIKTVGKALDAHRKHETVKQLLDSLCKTKFFDHLIMFTKEKQIIDNVWDDADRFFMTCTKILEEILNTLPKFAKTCMTVASDFLDTARCTKTIQRSKSVLAAITSLYERSKKVFLEEEKLKQKSRGRLWMSNNLEEPPDNFLELSIMPMKADLLEDAIPFIRRVKVEGGYKDVHQYLDVQFRLMRQDFIIPLREGISEFKKNNCKPGLKSSNLRFYFNVHIIGLIVDRGINHALYVGDSKFQRFQGGYSKRLMFGSLVCLSKDNFESVIFATVAHDISELHKGFIIINIKTGLNDAFNANSSDVYVMAETTAYFESYCHVLEGLQEMVTKLPLQDYIVHCKTELKPPQYLLPSGGVHSLPVYNISCLFDNKLPCRVPVLTTVKWPQADEMCLNESQREAAQLALTKELAIIQGPPGTGKTHVGLKVMQVLLENKDTLAGGRVNGHSPILVVCYTNHALDQFLEGVLKFCPEGIVRVGGQSKSEKLNEFNLRKLREKRRRENSHKRRKYVFDKRKMQEISGEICSLNQTMESLQIDIETELTLNRYMRATHHNSLIDGNPNLKNYDSIMNEWLTTSKQTTESLLSQMVQQHLIMLVLTKREGSKSDKLSPNMNIIQRANVYCYYLKTYEYQCKNEMQNLSNQSLTDDNRNKIHEIQYWLNIARTQILPDHQLCMVLPEGHLQTIYKCLKLDFNDSNDSDNVIKHWLLRPQRNIHQQLDDVQMLTNVGNQKKNDRVSLVPDYMFIKEQNNRMVDKDFIHIDKIKARVKNVVNSLTSAMKRAEALGIGDDTLTEADGVNNQWQTVKKGKLNLQALHRKLRFVKPMTEEEAKNVKSVWSLELDKRFALYNLWVQKYKLDLTEKMEDLVIEYKTEQEKQKNVENQETLDLLRKAKVIGMTTSGASRNRAVLQDVGCRIIVVEEAAEVLESHIVTSLNKHCKHLILIGDHQQLRPNPTVYQLAKEFGLEISLFERLINNKVPHVMLKEQHRMRPEISKIMRHIYPDLQDHPSVANFENIRGVSKNIFFIQHEHQETHLYESMSKANTHEAKFLVAFCQFLLNQDYKPSQITILATYSGQVFEIGKVMKERNLDPSIVVTAVDNYEGEENDIILLSLVRSNDENQVGFLKVDNRVCVALSRAKKGLFAIGNLQLLAAHSKLWSKIVRTATSEDTIDSGLRIHCHNHPDFTEIVTFEKDFLKFPDGGCGRPCVFRLNCGHVCDLLCHGYDPEHIVYKCKNPCTRKCESGHPCKLRCSVECLCSVLVLKEMLHCDHENQVPCHVPVEEATCSMSCTRILDCGHPCTGICGQCRENSKHNKCHVVVDLKWPCRHTEIIPCYKTKLQYLCEQVCGAERDCGHVCPGKCSRCKLQGQHEECHFQVQHQWPCGHKENVPCYTRESSYACQQVCEAEFDCGHVCSGICGQCKLNKTHHKCDVNVEHQWPCGHKENVPCYTIKSSYLDRPILRSKRLQPTLISKSKTKYPCKQVCGAERDCGHPCTGICGQCSEIGRHDICQEPVQCLKDCGHSEAVPCIQATSAKPVCKNVCGSYLPCGHQCAGICGKCKIKLEHEKCKVPMQYRRKCGHVGETPCHARASELLPCKQICGAELKCRHICKGTCSECLQGTVHLSCQEKCLLSLPCGHSCEGFCSTPCLPCTQICPNQCNHGACFQERNPPLCGHTCRPCMVKWNYRCPHLKYTRICSNIGDIKPCAKYCRKYLPSCQHLCAGLCGEICVCAKCDTVSDIPQIYATKEGDSIARKFESTKERDSIIGNSESTTEDDSIARNYESLKVVQDNTNSAAENKIEKQRNEQRRSNNKQNQRLIKLPSCGHIFFFDDLDKYVNRFGHNGSTYIPCPVCQKPIQNFIRFENINIVRSRKRAVQKEKLQHETGISDKQKSDLLASKKFLDYSLINNFLILDTKQVTNIVTLSAASFQIKCAFVLNTILSVMKDPQEATSTKLLMSRHDAVLNIKGRLTNQQREEFTTELLRCFWLYCLSHLDTINVPDDVKESQDNEMDAELKVIIKDLSLFRVTGDILTRAELLSDRKNKRIQRASKSEADKAKSLFLEQSSSKVLKTLASSDDDMLYNMKERNFQGDLPKHDHSNLQKISKLVGQARQNNNPPRLSREGESQASKAYGNNKPAHRSREVMPQSSKDYSKNIPAKDSREEMPQASKDYNKKRPPRWSRKEMPQASKNYSKNKPSQCSREEKPQASKDFLMNKPPQLSSEEMPQASKDNNKNKPPHRSTEEMPQASKDNNKKRQHQLSREEIPQASKNDLKDKPSQRSREEMPQAATDNNKNKPPYQSREEMPQASKNYLKDKPSQRSREEMPQAATDNNKNKPQQLLREEMPQASKHYNKKRPPRWSREQMPQASKNYLKNKPSQCSREEKPQASKDFSMIKPPQLSSEEMPQASKDNNRNKPPHRSREEMPQASKDNNKKKPQQLSREEIPQASKDYLKNKPSQRSREEMPQAATNYSKNKPSQCLREEKPQASIDFSMNNPPQLSSEEMPQAAKDNNKNKPQQLSREEIPQVSKDYTKYKQSQRSREEMPTNF